MFKNVTGQKWIVYAYQDEGGSNPFEPVTGDAANITANLRLDGGAANAVDDTNPAELEDGFYVFDLTQAETNADLILIAPASSTANVNVVGVPAACYTRDWAKSAITDILEDTGTTLDTKLDDIQGATFDTATDSLEAIRNRGDSAWTGSAVTSDSGTAQAGSSTTITLQAGAPAADNVLEGHLVFITAGTGAGQAKAIAENGYDGTTKVATIIGAWEVNPDNTSVYDVYPDAITEITDPPDAPTIADAVWNEATAGHTSAGTFGEQCKNDIDAILADTAQLQTDWVNGGRLDLILDDILADTAVIGAAGAGLTAIPWNAAWDAEVQSECADALNAYDPPTKTELDALIGTPAGADIAADIAAVKSDTAAILTDTGTTLDALINTIDGKVDTIDTVVDAIKVVTDQMNFGVSNRLDVNVTHINETVVLGTGIGADLWRG